MTSRKLKSVALDELSLVDVPADPNAKIAFWKRAKDDYKDLTDAQKGRMKKLMDDGMSEEDAYKACQKNVTNKGDGSVTTEELTKQLEALQAQVTDLTKSKAAAEAQVEALEKSADEVGMDVQDGKLVKRADPEYVEIDGERVEKASVPAPLLRLVEKQNAELAKMRAEQEETRIAKRGETELPNLAGTALAKGKLLEAVGEDADILKALRGADALIAKAAEEIGHNVHGDEASATYRLNKMATEYAATKGVPFESAYAEVTKAGEGRSLYAESRAEAN